MTGPSQLSKPETDDFDLSDPVASAIMGAAKLHTHDHELAYRITRYAMQSIQTIPAQQQPRPQVLTTDQIWRDYCKRSLGDKRSLRDAIDYALCAATLFYDGTLPPQESVPMIGAIQRYANDLRRNSSGGDDYPWEMMRGVADELERIIDVPSRFQSQEVKAVTKDELLDALDKSQLYHTVAAVEFILAKYDVRAKR